MPVQFKCEKIKKKRYFNKEWLLLKSKERMESFKVFLMDY